MRRMGAIPVVRRMDAEGKIDYEAFFSSCVETLTAGESIVIFPEGQSLPQPYMTSLRTGTARLFFLAFDKGVRVNIVPVGLNYERGSVFRTPVVVSVAPPLQTSNFVEKHADDPQKAVNDLTDEIARSLNEHVFQTNDFRERDLMLLLERIYRNQQIDNSWPERLKRLKKYGNGLNTLRGPYSHEIDRLRRMLSHYEMQAITFEKRYGTSDSGTHRSIWRFLKALAGLPLAGCGALLNILPYKCCSLLVNHIKKHHEAAAATYKVAYSIFLFPVAYLGEWLLIHWWFGWVVSIPFAVGIIPLSYFTLFYFEWLADGGWGIPMPSKRLKKIQAHRISRRLHNQRRRIQDQMDVLADRIEAIARE
jgi:hypothetical protein